VNPVSVIVVDLMRPFYTRRAFWRCRCSSPTLECIGLRGAFLAAPLLRWATSCADCLLRLHRVSASYGHYQ